MTVEEQTKEKFKRLLASGRLLPIKAISINCLDCTGYQLVEVYKCPCNGTDSTLCPFHSLRLSKKRLDKYFKNPILQESTREGIEET